MPDETPPPPLLRITYILIPTKTVYFGDCQCGCAFKTNDVRPLSWWRWLFAVVEVAWTICPGCGRRVGLSKHVETGWLEMLRQKIENARTGEQE